MSTRASGEVVSFPTSGAAATASGTRPADRLAARVWPLALLQNKPPSYVLLSRPPASGNHWVFVLVPPPFDPATFDTTLDLLGERVGLVVYQPPAASRTVEAHLDDLTALVSASGAARVSLVAPGVSAALALHAATSLGASLHRIVLVSPSFPRSVGVPMGLPSSLMGAVAAHPSAMRITSRHEIFARAPALGRVLAKLGVQVPHMPADATPLPGTAQEGAFLADAVSRAKAPALERIEQAVLVVTGAKDAAFPPASARALVRRLPRGEHVLVAGGSQFLAREYPDLLAVRIEAFLT